MRKKIFLLIAFFVLAMLLITGCFRKDNSSMDITTVESMQSEGSTGQEEGTTLDKTENATPPLDVEDEVIINIDETESAGGM